MNNKHEETHQVHPQQPTSVSSSAPYETHQVHHQQPTSASSSSATPAAAASPYETHQVHHQKPTSASSATTPAAAAPYPPAGAAPYPPETVPPYPPADENVEKWGTHVMGQPDVPSSHPNNQKAAYWSGQEHHPYVQYSPVDKPNKNPYESAVNVFNSWTSKAETLAQNIWHNLKTGSSVSETAWGKVGLTAKAITGGGFESIYKQTFNTAPNEKLKKTFACYLSTSTGPVAGTLYLSNVHIAFCSDRPLTFTAPSGQQAWSYYKVMVPLAMVRAVTPVSMTENPSEKYIQINTVDGHDFWFMGFVNYEKASVHLSRSISEFQAQQMPPQMINH